MFKIQKSMYAPEFGGKASALINVARNVGGSIGVSLAQNVLAHRQQFHQSRLVEHVVPSNVRFQETLRRAVGMFAIALWDGVERKPLELHHTDRRLALASHGMPIVVARDPLNCVAIGSGQCLEEFEALKRVLITSTSR